MRTLTIRIGLFLSLVLVSAWGEGSPAAEIAVVVNRANAVEELSFKELVKVFTNERRHWPDGTRIYLIMREAGSPEMGVMLRRVYRMREDAELKAFWLAMLFREELGAFPQFLSSNEAVLRFVQQVPTAVGFVDADRVDARVKVVRIDGRQPGEPAYPLSE